MGEAMTGELRVLQQLNKYEFAFEADILRDGLVQGGRWSFRNLESNYLSFKGQPVLVAYTHNGRKIGDGHNGEDKIDPKTGEAYRSFTAPTAERIVGMISEDESDLTLIERDNQLWLRVKGRIWAEYAKELIDHIMLTGSMAVSVEVMVEQGYEEDGVEVFEVWNGIGLTVLGDDVAPAVPNANIRALAAMQEEFKEMKLRVASLVKEDSEDIKPQNNSEKKGMKNQMRLSKKQAAALQEKFLEAHIEQKLLAAEQYDDGSIVACLMDNSGSTATYVMASLDETIYPEKLHTFNAQVHFCSDGKEDVCVDASDMAECVAENAKECAERAEAAEKQLAECKAEMDTMKKNEDARRLAAAKKTASDTLAEFNADRETKVDAKCLEALNKEIEAGKFTACEDENHLWNGDAVVKEKVLSICALADMEQQKKLAAARQEPKPMTWGGIKQASAAPGTVGELFASKNH